MIQKSLQLVALASTFVVSASGFASAQMSSGAATVSMRAIVPVVCRVGFTAGGPADALGVASQLCNNPTGYTLHALATGDVDGAVLIIDGQRIPLIEGEKVLIEDSAFPANKATVIGYDPGANSDGGDLTLLIEAN
jgi:hypothetical protein